MAKTRKSYYLPKEPQLIEVPAYQFITLTGEGNPNRPEFSEQISALYMMAYGLRMGLKKAPSAIRLLSIRYTR